MACSCSESAHFRHVVVSKNSIGPYRFGRGRRFSQNHAGQATTHRHPPVRKPVCGSENPILIKRCPKSAIEAREMGLRTVRTKSGQMVRARSVQGGSDDLSSVPSTTCRTRIHRSCVLVVHADGDDAAISFLAFEIYDVPRGRSSLSSSRRPPQGAVAAIFVSRVRDLRSAAREFVDLLFSSSTQGRRRSDVVSRVRDLRRADGEVEETMRNSAESRSPQCHRRTCEHAISNADPTAFA